ncbi:hypothetical protein EON64_21165 [archaeon]|nr:MAG: hypothetical protein EON64_21165 [archaeon]
MLFCGLSAIFSYRLLDLPKPITKPLHAFVHLCAAVFVIVGLWCVFLGNNDTGHNTAHMYFANLYSLHSFIGLAAVLVYFSNYLLGFVYFLSGVCAPASRAWYLPSHTFLGVFSVLLVFMAVETGIMDLFRELGCDIAVDSADTNPAENYSKLKEGCRVGNAAGILVLLTALLAFFALYDFSPRTHNKAEGDYLLGNQRT